MAAYEVLLLNTTLPQIQAAQSGDTYVVPRDITFSTNATFTTGTANGVMYLNGDKVVSTGSLLTFNGTTFTAPSLSLTNALSTTSGGTGLSSFTAGDLTYYSTGTALSKLAIGTANQVLTSSGTAPQWTSLSSIGVTSVSFGSTGLTPSSATAGAISVAGTLVTSNGGTGLSSYTAGDLVYYSTGTALSKLAIGTASQILTSSGSAPQWSTASGISVGTATNLAGGAAGSVPYQSGAGATTFLSIGAANRVLTSTGSAPQWVTSLTGLTGVSSSSITNTALTSGRVVYSTTGGAQTDSASLTFDGTTFATTTVDTTNLEVTNIKAKDGTAAASIADSTGVVTVTAAPVMSALTASQAVFTTAGKALTSNPITGTGNVVMSASPTLTGTVAGASLQLSSLTSGRVTYAGASGLLQDSANLTFNGTDLTVSGAVNAGTVNATTSDMTNLEVTNIKAKDGTAAASIADSTGKITVTQQMTIDGIEVGQGAGNVSTNTAVGVSALQANTTGYENTAVGYWALYSNTTGIYNTASGLSALYSNTTGAYNTAFGREALYFNSTGNYNTATGFHALVLNTTGSNNTAIGRDALVNNTTASRNTAVGYQAGYSNTTGPYSTFVGHKAGYSQTTPSGGNTFIGDSVGYSATTGEGNIAIGTINSNGNNPSGYDLTTGSRNTFIGHTSGATVTTGSKNTILGGYNGNQDGLDIRTASNYAVISDGDGNRLLSTANGYSLALDGGAVPQSGTGITFPATQSASSDANTLDDYEEGTWTPVINGVGGAPTGASYTTRNASYTKIGNLVNVRFYFEGTITGAGSGDYAITGLPFTSNASAQYPSTKGALGYLPNEAYIYVGPNGTRFLIGKTTAGGTLTGVSWGDANVSATNFQMHIQLTYFV